MTIKADYRQFVAEDKELVAILAFLAGAVPVVYNRCEQLIAYTSLGLLAFVFLVCLTRYVMLVSRKWIISDEQLCSVKGVFARHTDYIELYRIVDYKESQSLLQRLMGIKTVTVFSTDRSDAMIDIRGISVDDDVIGHIREKVENCKIDKRIYEITNN
jgi:uncharacterized membrane protein YdbT with pleckstrin-like domain